MPGVVASIIPPILIEDDENAVKNLNQEEEEAVLHKKLNDDKPEAEEYIDSPEIRFESIK